MSNPNVSEDTTSDNVLSKAASLLDKNISKVKMKFGSEDAPNALNRACAVAVDSTNSDVVVVDAYNHNIHIFSSSGTPILCFGSKGSGPDEFDLPDTVVINQQRQLIISDYNNHRLKIHNRDGSLHQIIGKEGPEDGNFNYPRGLALGKSGDIHVCDAWNSRVQVLSPDGTYLRQYKVPGCSTPWYISIMGDDTVCVGDYQRFVVLDQQNQPRSSWCVEGLATGFCLKDNTHVLISEEDSNTINVYSVSGDLMKVFDVTEADPLLFGPRGLSFDNNGDIYVTCGRTVLKF